MRPERQGQEEEEYDPEWGRAFYEGAVGASCRRDTDHAAHEIQPARFATVVGDWARQRQLPG